MQKYQIFFTKRALKDLKILNEKQKDKLQKILLEFIAQTPHKGKKLVGSLDGNYSYRLDIKNRIIYSICEEKKCIYIKRTRTHYGE